MVEPTEEEKYEKKRHFGKQQAIFIDYINHGWDEDKKWLAFCETNPELI